MNEVTLHRGRFPHLTSLGCFVDGEYLTECVVSKSIIEWLGKRLTQKFARLMGRTNHREYKYKRC